MPTILINATAARYSGALIILKDFMSYLYETEFLNCQFHLFTTTNGVFQNSVNIIVHEFEPQNWLSRIRWDRNGLQKWCKQNAITPDLSVSFQNTCTKLTDDFKNVKQLVYYHQSLPLIKHKWHICKKEERTLFLYSHFYGFFVNRWNDRAEYVVQLPYIKALFCEKFKNISSDRVHIVRPKLPKIDIESVVLPEIDSDKKIFIFPATPLEYKNHTIILCAVKQLIAKNIYLSNKLKVFFTISDTSEIAKQIKFLGLDNVISCIDSMPYDKLLGYYKRCDALLFPSKIETYGLPLVEAALFGKKIVAADLPYAREVLEDYNGVSFISPDDVNKWADMLETIIESDSVQYEPLKSSSVNTWKSFMDICLRQCNYD